jgi:succinate dehydrogenase flavin-adding protein (antitoxin of CptAB toxin-antitoxin module)
LLGAFVDQHLGEFGAEELHLLDRLLETDDAVIDDWVRGRQPFPRSMTITSWRRSGDFALRAERC